MPTDAGTTGQSAYLKFGSMVFHTYYRSAEGSEEAEFAEYSAGSDANKLYLLTQKDGSYSTEVVVPSGTTATTGTAFRAAFAVGSGGTLEIAPEGTASTKPKKTVYAYVKSRGEPLTYNDITTMSVEFQYHGAVTDTAYS